SDAKMITMPPMVGVPLLLACPAAASSSWISWPKPCLTKMRIATGVPSSAIAIDSEADNKRVLKDPHLDVAPNQVTPDPTGEVSLKCPSGPPVPVLRVMAGAVSSRIASCGGRYGRYSALAGCPRN